MLKSQWVRMLFAFVLVLLPLNVFFPFLPNKLFNYILSKAQDGSIHLAVLLFITVGVTGVILLKGYRRLGWLLFVAASYGAFRQGEALRTSWNLWIIKGYDVVQAAFLMNTVALFAILFVLASRKATVRVEPMVAISFKLIAAFEIFLICLPKVLSLFAGPNYSAFLPDIAYAFYPVMDSLGVREATHRSIGMLGNPITDSALLLLVWPAFLCNLPSRLSHRRYAFAALVFGAVIFSISLTFTRSAYIGLAIQSIILLYWWHRSGNTSDPRRYYPLAAVVLLLVAFVLLYEPVRLRWQSLLIPTDASILNRLRVFGTATALLMERPFSGWGVGSFNTLYNVFYRIPLVEYGYSDAHSVVFCGLLNTGLAGWALFVVAIFGVRPWKTFRILPLWILLSLAGVAFPLLSDNLFTRQFSISVPLAMLIGISGLYARRFESGVPKASRTGYATVAGLAILWIGGSLIPPLEPAQRLVKQITRTTSSARADVSVYVENQISGETWGRHENQPFASQLATLASLTRVAQNSMDFPITASEFKISPAARSSLNFTLPASDWMTLALSTPADPAVKNLFHGFPPDIIEAQSKELFGNESSASITLPTPCAHCSLNLAQADPLTAAGPLNDKRTSASAARIMDAFQLITDPRSAEGRLAAEAMVANHDHTGLTRYLVRAPWIQHCSMQTDTTREEILIIDKGLSSKWAVVMLYSSKLPSRARTDSLPNRMFAEVGWRLYCYFDAHPAMAMTTLPVQGNRGQ